MSKYVKCEFAKSLIYPEKFLFYVKESLVMLTSKKEIRWKPVRYFLYIILL